MRQKPTATYLHTTAINITANNGVWKKSIAVVTLNKISPTNFSYAKTRA